MKFKEGICETQISTYMQKENILNTYKFSYDITGLF